MSEMILRQHIIGRLREAVVSLYATCRLMPEDRFTWEPSIEGNTGRSAESQIHECALLDEWAAVVFAIREATPPDLSNARARAESFVGRDAKLEWLQYSTEALANTIDAFSDEELLSTLTHPLTGQTCTWADLAEMFIWKLSYHQGQINYIQTLYGDRT